jgi:hypothetical protein
METPIIRVNHTCYWGANSVPRARSVAGTEQDGTKRIAKPIKGSAPRTTAVAQAATPAHWSPVGADFVTKAAPEEKVG